MQRNKIGVAQSNARGWAEVHKKNEGSHIKMAWEDNFNKLVESTLPINEKKEWRFTMEEHKTKGTMQFGIRAFNTSGNYIGPTKNGFLVGIESEEQVEAFRKKFNEFIDEVKGML